MTVKIGEHESQGEDVGGLGCGGESKFALIPTDSRTAGEKGEGRRVKRQGKRGRRRRRIIGRTNSIFSNLYNAEHIFSIPCQ